MKIMFITEHFYPFRDATSNCVYELARQLKNYGNDVLILSDADDRTYMGITEVDNVCTRWMNVPHRLTRKKLRENYKHNKCKYLLVMLIKIINRFFKLRYSELGCDRLSVVMFCREIRKCYLEIKPDYIIAAFMPTELARACYELKRKKKINCKYVVYHTDEYIENYAFSENGVNMRKKWLGQIYTEAANVFMTPLMLKKYMQYYPLNRKKFLAIEFPLMAQKSITEVAIPWSEDGIHCLYCGTFYPKIRNPKYLINIFSELEQENIHLHLIMAADFILEKYGIEYLPKNVHIHPTMKQEESFFLMKKADVLVNIGNAFSNMLPSKIFDMFSSGRPIIHLAQIPECTSLPYMEKYPNVLVIRQYEKEKLNEHVGQIKKFAMDSICRDDLKIEDLCQKFSECTPEYVARLVEEKLVGR